MKYVILKAVINLKATGLIVEYNPFHNGHLFHLRQARELTQAEVIIAIMSGDFVQRGEPAVINKWERTKQALISGVDLVIELPFVFTNQAASKFAHGAVTILNHLKTDYLVFGSETANLIELQDFADLNINPDNLKEIMKQGYAYPKAYGILAKEMGPNDILAVAYLKAVKNTSIQPVPIKRIDNNYHDLNLTGEISSASAIRKAILNKADVALQTAMAKTFLENEVYAIDSYYPIIRHLLLTHPNLNNIALFSEGIENHLRKIALNNLEFQEFINQAVSKRYTRSRIQRLLINLLVNLNKSEFDTLIREYQIRILGFNRIGQQYLNYLKEFELENIITNFASLSDLNRKITTRLINSYLYPYSIESKKRLLKRELMPPVII